MKADKPVYRIIHINNLEYILETGKLCCPNHVEADPNYRSIGLTDLIKKRSEQLLPLADNKTFKDYVAFYFGPRSPMLYKIFTGHGRVEKVSQSKIVYLISGTEIIVKHSCHFIFTDGHATQKITKFFDDLKNLKNIDWKAVNARIWKDDPSSDTNFDRQRKKQAEFLVEGELPLSCITKIVTYDEGSQKYVLSLLKERGLTIPVYIDKNLYYE